MSFTGEYFKKCEVCGDSFIAWSSRHKTCRKKACRNVITERNRGRSRERHRALRVVFVAQTKLKSADLLTIMLDPKLQLAATAAGWDMRDLRWAYNRSRANL